MTKKIDSIKSGSAQSITAGSSITATQRSEATSAIRKALKVDSISSNAKFSTVPINRNNKKEMLQILEAEAKDFFRRQKIPKSQQKSIIDAVRMTIEAASTDEDSD
ncbi:MAG: hypothetical protein PHC51_00710 [bacterium]|nr:hypothetical protein [bacterium]